MTHNTRIKGENSEETKDVRLEDGVLHQTTQESCSSNNVPNKHEFGANVLKNCERLVQIDLISIWIVFRVHV